MTDAELDEFISALSSTQTPSWGWFQEWGFRLVDALREARKELANAQQVIEKYMPPIAAAVKQEREEIAQMLENFEAPRSRHEDVRLSHVRDLAVDIRARSDKK